MHEFLIVVVPAVFSILIGVLIFENKHLKKALKFNNKRCDELSEDLDKALEIGIDQMATYQVMLDRNMELEGKNNSLVKALKNVRDELIKQRS